jgi:hypothetical protein
MAHYDSDSSGGGDDEYTETNVLLGYAAKEPSEDTISQLGGNPVSQYIHGLIVIIKHRSWVQIYDVLTSFFTDLA